MVSGVEVNYVAVVASAIANMALGFVWYGPLFGKMWMKLSGHTMQNMDSPKAKAKMNIAYGLAFVGSLVTAYVLTHSLVFASYYTGITGIEAGWMAGFWSWLGFVAPVTLGVVLWEGKSWKLYALTNGYYLISLLLMGSILSVWM